MSHSQARALIHLFSIHLLEYGKGDLVDRVVIMKDLAVTPATRMVVRRVFGEFLQKVLEAAPINNRSSESGTSPG